MLTKLDELSELLEGDGPGRGRGRGKKSSQRMRLKLRRLKTRKPVCQNWTPRKNRHLALPEEQRARRVTLRKIST
jgi:hypothetical protein